MKLDYPEIKEWAIIINRPNPFVAPELCSQSIFGRVYGSSRFEDGLHICTSSIQRFVYEQGVVIAETKNSKYILRAECVAPEYEKEYGNVWEKLLERIEKE